MKVKNIVSEGWFNFPGKYVDTFRTLKKSGRLDSCGGAHQSAQDFLQRRGVRHSRQFQRAVPCPLAPLKLVVIPEQLQQEQQPLAHPPVNLQVRAQLTVQRLRQTRGAVEQVQDVPDNPHDGLQLLGDVRGHIQVQFLTVLPDPQDKCLGLPVHLLEHRPQQYPQCNVGALLGGEFGDAIFCHCHLPQRRASGSYHPRIRPFFQDDGG